MYYSLKSGRQIRELINSNYKDAFLTMISKRLKISPRVFFSFYSNNKSDSELYELMRRHMKLEFRKKQKGTNVRNTMRADDIQSILDTLNVDVNVISYLDVGADDCLVTLAIKDKLHIKNVVACDIVDKCKGVDDIHFVKLIPGQSSQLKSLDYDFDLITAFQSIHHMIDRDFRLQEIDEKSNPQAIFIVREHDADTDHVKMLIDIEHLIYEVLFDNVKYEDFVNEYYANYLNDKELEDIMSHHNFRRVYRGQLFSETRYYYSAYVHMT